MVPSNLISKPLPCFRGCWKRPLTLQLVSQTVPRIAVAAGAESGEVLSAGPTVSCVPLQTIREQGRGRLHGILAAAVPVHQRHDDQRVGPDGPGEGRPWFAGTGHGQGRL